MPINKTRFNKERRNENNRLFLCINVRACFCQNAFPVIQAKRLGAHRAACRCILLGASCLLPFPYCFLLASWWWDSIANEKDRVAVIILSKVADDLVGRVLARLAVDHRCNPSRGSMPSELYLLVFIGNYSFLFFFFRFYFRFLFSLPYTEAPVEDRWLKGALVWLVSSLLSSFYHK